MSPTPVINRHFCFKKVRNLEQELTEIKNSGFDEKPAPILTPRQMEVLELTARGFSHLQISERLGISCETVRTHLSQRREYGLSDGIFARLDACSGREAVVKAIALGLLDPEELVSKEEMERCSLLTSHQIEILSWLANPNLPSLRKRDIEIGERVNLVGGTVRSRLTSIYKKLEMGVERKQKSTRAVVIFSAYQQRRRG